MLKLGINVDHVATLRQARYAGCDTGEPDPLDAARVCLAAGAHGITVHLREDRRHIQERDVLRIRGLKPARLNLEMANEPAIIAFALSLKPEIVCIVPERRKEITTEGGLDVKGHANALGATCRKMKDAGIEVSLFITPDPEQVEMSAKVGANCVELHTGAFADEFRETGRAGGELERLVAAAQLAHSANLQVNAGHGLNYQNVPLLYNVPHLSELNIGHSIVSRAIFSGLSQAVREMLGVMQGYSA
jgi:pyridoxine 5-phosphate synthase